MTDDEQQVLNSRICCLALASAATRHPGLLGTHKF